MVLHLHQQGLTVSDISRETGINHKTVRKYIEWRLDVPAYGPRKPRATVIDPFASHLREWVKTYPASLAVDCSENFGALPAIAMKWSDEKSKLSTLGSTGQGVACTWAGKIANVAITISPAQQDRSGSDAGLPDHTFAQIGFLEGCQMAESR